MAVETGHSADDILETAKAAARDVIESARVAAVDLLEAAKKAGGSDHNHNGLYTREESCTLRQTNIKQEISASSQLLWQEVRSLRKLTWGVLTALIVGFVGVIITAAVVGYPK